MKVSVRSSRVELTCEQCQRGLVSGDDGVQPWRVQVRGERGRQRLLAAPRGRAQHARRRRRVRLRPVPHRTGAACWRARARVARTAHTDAYVAF